MATWRARVRDRLRLRDRLQSLSAPLLLLLAIGVVGYEIALFGVLLRQPSDQAGVFFGRRLLVEQPPTAQDTPQRRPLREGDAILEIEEAAVGEGLLTPGQWQRQIPADTAGTPHTYTVLRDGKTLRVAVPWQRYTALGLLARGGALWIVGLALTVSAIGLFTGYGQDRAARLIGLSFVMGALNQINNLLPAAGANVALRSAWFFIPLDAVSVWLAISGMLHAVQYFPEVKAPARRFPRRLWLMHLVVPAVSLAAGFAFGGDTLLSIRDTMFAVTNPLLVVEVALTIATLTHTYVRSRRPGVRNQIRWIIWGFSVALVPWTVFRVVPSLLFGTTWLPLSVANLALILVPVTFIISIFRFGLMDVDRLINRTLVYGLTGGALALIYFLVAFTMRDLLPPVEGRPNDFLAGVIATAVLFVVFNPLRIYAQQAVNRVFYREQLDFNHILREVGGQLSTTMVPEAVYALLTDDISARLGLAYATILTHDPDRGGYVAQGTSVALNIPEDTPLVAWLDAHRAPLTLYQPRGVPPEVREAVQPLAEAQAEVCLPLFQRDTLLGLYVFGSKRSGNLLTREELNHLELLGHQAAAALQNARFYAELQNYSRTLEARVQARTAELEAERNRLDTILQNVADGLVVTDPRDHVVLVNAAFADIVNRPAEEVLGRPLAAVAPAEDLRALIDAALADPGAVHTADIPGARAKQVYKASACALMRQGLSDARPTETREDLDPPVPLGVVTILRDITHEREVDRMKTELISMVSHELRTPLTSVLGFTKLIRKTFGRDIAPQVPQDERRTQRALQRVRDNLDIIVSEGERLTRLINDVLDIAKMEAGRTEWHMAEVAFDEVIETSVNALQGLAKQKELPIAVEAERPLPTVTVDRDRIVQVLTNLLSNALKFTDEGRVTVRARHADGGTDLPPGAWLWVSVEDTGVGIPEDRLPDVFEKFKQVSETQANRPKGTGLGLPICREIVEQHAGRIWAESEVGVGSTFNFVLPLAEAAAPTPLTAQAEAEAPVAVPTSGCRILVVEDEAHIRDLLRQELTDAGYAVLEAGDGMAALDTARSAAPDLILLDIMIPRITGFDVISVLKGDPETADIPIVILSGVEDRERGFRLGADGYLTKPIDSALLLSTLSEMLEQARSCPLPQSSGEP